MTGVQRALHSPPRRTNRPAAPAPTPPSRLRLRTPGQLVLAMIAAVLCSLLIGGVGLWLGLRQSALLGSAADRSEDVVALVGVQTDLTLAHATTTNAFLVGGLEPADLREAADEAFYAGAAGLAQQAGSAPAPGPGEVGPLALASADVAVYAGLIEQARAANRQGFPVGVAYLGQATDQLTDEILPVVDAAAVDVADAAARDFNGATHQRWFATLLILPLAGLIALQTWLSRRTRRLINVPFALGTALVGLGAIGLFVVLGSSGDQAQDVREGKYVPTIAAAQALSNAAQARSDEAFALINRGSGAAYEESFAAHLSAARADLERGRNAPTGSSLFSGLVASISAWDEAHQEIRVLDDAGDWDAAVALATSREADSPSARYEDFASQTESAVATLAQETRSGLADASTAPVFTGWLVALLGVGCAVLSARGLDARLKEYR